MLLLYKNSGRPKSIGTVALTGFWSAPFGQKHKWSLWPSELLLPILSTLNSHLFTEHFPRLNSQLTISTAKIRCIEKSKPSQAAATTSPQFPRFVRFSASICHGKEHGSQMQRRRFLNDRRFGGGFIHLVPPKPSQTWCLLVAWAGRAHFFWLKSGGTAVFGAFFCTYVTFRGGVGWNSNVHHTTFLTRRSWLFLPPFLGLGEVGWSNNVLWHLHSRDATCHTNL